MAADDEISAIMTMDVDSVTSGAGEAADSVESAAGRMEESFGGVGEALDSIQGSIKNAFEVLGITAAYEAIEKVADALGEITEKGEHLEQTAMLYQTNTTALQGLYTAAVQTGIGTETMDRGLRTLTMRLQSAREGSIAMQDKLETVGITMQNLTDPTFNATEAMYKVAASGASTGEMMSVLGPRAILVSESFEKLKEGQEAVNSTSESLGALTEKQISTLTEYHQRVSTLKLQFDNFKSAIVADMIPALETMMEGFGRLFSSVNNGDDVMQGFHSIMEEVAEDLVRVVGLAKYFADGMIGAFTLVGKVVGGLVAIMSADLGDLGTTVDVVMEDVTKSFNTSTAAMDLDAKNTMQIIEELHDTFAGLKDFGDDGTDWDGKGKEKPKPKPIEIPPPKITGEDPILKMIGIQIEEAKKGSQERIDLTEQYATRSAQVYEGDVDKAIDAYKKTLDAYKEQKAAQLKTAEDTAKKENDLESKSFDEAQKLLSQAHSAKQIDDASYLTAEESLFKGKMAVNENYYDQLDKLDAGNADKMRANLAAREKMEETTAKNIYDAQAKYAQETEKAWESAMKPIASSWTTAMQSMANGTATFQSALKKMLDDMVTGLFKNAMDTMVHNWITGEQQKTNASIIGDKLRTSSAEAASVQTSVASSTGAKTEIQNSGLSAMAGAYKAMVGVPYIGPILAVAAMAAAEAAVLGLIGKIASAEGGMVVDRDQMAMVHEDEMILPSHISQGINERILNNDPMGGSGGSNKGGGDHYHISAHDSKSFESYVTSHAGRTAIAKAAKMASMRGNSHARSYAR